MKKHVLSIDFTVVVTAILLMTVGIISISSATNDTKKLAVQLLACSLGIAAMLALTFWDYRSIMRHTHHIYFLSIFLLAIVFPFGIGKEETGAISWIRFGSIGIQPSEFVKILFCLFLSCELPPLIEGGTLNEPKELLKFLGKCFPVVALVILQNDTGTALVFVFMLIVCLFISGISVKYILIAAGAAIISLPVIWAVMSDYQKDRITVFFNPEAELSDSGYQVNLSKLALASGGILGRGYGKGAINSLSYLPEKDTDFIFSVIGEESGLLGTMTVIALFLILILRCFYIAKRAPDLQGRVISTGVCAWLTFHVVENVGMTLGLLPVTGIPLPFVSYGGSSVLSMSMAIGLILSVRRKTFNLHFN